MSLAVVYSRASQGVKAPLVTVEAQVSNGLPAFSIVGLPETTVTESKDRVRCALINSRFDFPTRRITINLAPADLPKEGARFDLPIALGILAASNQMPIKALLPYEFAGELALSGELRPIPGILPFALASRAAKRDLIVPLGNAQEASLPGDATIFAAGHLLEVFKHLTQEYPLSPFKEEISTLETQQEIDLNLSEVRGQLHAKRSLEIAAAGGHSLLMIGPPGTGKSMLASRLPGILPPLTKEEVLEVTAVYSLLQNNNDKLAWGKRPFRAPHHTSSSAALVGGGAHPRPGEISLAHHGILFLDELPQFNRQVLEVLREPLETGTILISRARGKIEFPARFQLIAAMNPCPCGYLSDSRGRCRCTEEQVKRHRNRLSGPLLDRIDMHLEVTALSQETLLSNPSVPIEDSDTVRTRVMAAHQRQRMRGPKPNARLNQRETVEFCILDPPSQSLMQRAIERLGLSARSYFRILRVARTIADLGSFDNITRDHVAEAISYRKLDRTVE